MGVSQQRKTANMATAKHRSLSSARLLFSHNSSLYWPEYGREEAKPPKWVMGILNDPKAHDVPGRRINLSKLTG